MVVDGHTADLLIVAARTGGQCRRGQGLTLFLVNPKAKGVATERTIMVDAHNAARIEFDNVEVNADSVLGEVDQGGALLEGVLNIGRGAVASEMVGLSEEVFGRTVTYLKERKQFGKTDRRIPGAAASRRRNSISTSRSRRAAVLKALQALDADIDKAGSAVAVAKAKAGTTATRAVQEGVQMHGGMGMTDQFDIGFFMKRARVCEELFGDANFHADQLARSRRVIEAISLLVRSRASARELWARAPASFETREDAIVMLRCRASRHLTAGEPRGVAQRLGSRSSPGMTVLGGRIGLTGSAARTECRRRSRAGSGRAGSAAWIRRRHCGRTSRRNCRHGG